MYDAIKCIYEHGIDLKIYDSGHCLTIKIQSFEDNLYDEEDHETWVACKIQKEDAKNITNVLNEWVETMAQKDYAALGQIAYEGYAKETSASDIPFHALSERTRKFWINSARAVEAYLASPSPGEA